MKRLRAPDALLLLAALASAVLAIARTREVPLVATAIAQGASPARSAPEARLRGRVRGGSPTRSPFRLDGIVPSRRHGEAPLPMPISVAEEPSTVYSVTVKALVGGAPWSAVLAGLPGEAGDRVVRVGDRIGPVLIGRIDGEGVRLVTSDTSWHVRLPEHHP